MKTIDVFIETPKGSAQKYKYDEKEKMLKLKKVLPLGMIFPFDFGFIPDTKGEDGDPIDVLLISEFAGIPGCKITSRVIGSISANQSGPSEKQVRNDRILAIPTASLMFENIKEINELPGDFVKQITAFFINYNHLEDKTFTPIGILDAEATIALLNK